MSPMILISPMVSSLFIKIALTVTVASTHTAACVGFVRWALAAVGVDALFADASFFI